MEHSKRIENHENIIASIHERLENALAPELLELEDQTKNHAGHNQEAKPYGNTHFNLLIVSQHFTALSRVQRQRAVLDALGDIFDTTLLHALSIKALTPDEYKVL